MRTSAAGALLFAALATGCSSINDRFDAIDREVPGSSPIEQVHLLSDGLWQTWYLRSQDVETFDTLDEMAKSVDMIVDGRIVGIGPSRVIREDEQSIAWYGSVTVAVGRTFKGAAADTVEFEVFFSQQGRYEKFLEASLPQERAIMFLRNKEIAALAAGWSKSEAATEAHYNMLVNQTQSHFREMAGGIHVPAPGSGDFTDAWEGRSMIDLERTLAALTS